MATTYGAGVYGSKPYGGKTSTYSPVGAAVYVFDKTGARKSVYMMGSGDFIGCSFTHDDAGCKSFALKFSTYANMIKSDIIKIYIFDSDDCFFTGVIRSVPVRGSTNTEYEYTGYGLNDYLLRVTTGLETYSSETIRTIVEDLIKTKVQPECIVQWIDSYVDILDTVIGEINFNYITIKEALKQLKSIADADGNDYRVGIDADGVFMFQARSSDLKNTLIVGASGKDGIQEYNPEDSTEAKTRLYVLKKDGTYYGEYNSLIGGVDIFEAKVTAPDLAHADIDAWAEGQLAQLEQDERQAQIQWPIETIKPLLLVSDGYLRIICNRPPTVKTITGTAWGAGVWGAGVWGGEQYTGITIDDTLKIKEVGYIIDGDQAVRNIQLGALPVTQTREVIEINKQIESLKTSVGV